MTVRCALLLTVLLVAAVGCGGHSAGPKPFSVDSECGDPSGARVTPVWLHTADGLHLYAVAGGSGKTGVVLVPESPPGDVCGWLPYMATLERAGLRVLALDYRGTGGSALTATARPYAYGNDLGAAIKQIRADGAKTVVLLGASFGGAAAMAYGPELDADAIVSVSGETALAEQHVNALAAIPRLRVPLLIVDTRHDSYLPVPDARKLLRRAGSPDKRTMFFPGELHGWDIVGPKAPYAAKARALILAWLRGHA